MTISPSANHRKAAHAGARLRIAEPGGKYTVNAPQVNQTAIQCVDYAGWRLADYPFAELPARCYTMALPLALREGKTYDRP